MKKIAEEDSFCVQSLYYGASTCCEFLSVSIADK